ncbi:MAG: hypothetical protein DRO88_10490 [Promethearchaeia archaeon]|nr:MAG: hypothetical protein DRO88_10490 [Candidatus Lokiarchaeia archaeon]
MQRNVRSVQKKKNNYKIAAREMQVLMALEQDPLGTYDELAQISGISKSVVFNILRKLERNENESESFFRVVAHPNLLNLGLEVVDVISTINNRNQLLNLIKLGISHPYTIFQAFVYGASNGMLNQFRIPIGSGDKIQSLFSILKKEKQIEDFTFHQFNPKVLYTTTKVSKWDPETNSWEFSWENWFEAEISQNPNTKINLSTVYPINTGKSKKWIKQKDLAILSELTANTRRKNLDIMDSLKKKNKKYEFTPQTFGRHLKRVSDECISNHRVFFHELESDQTNGILIQGYVSPTKIKQLIRRIKNIEIPFTSTFKYNETEIHWFMKLPASKIHTLLPRLLYFVKDMRFYTVDTNSAYVYLLYPETFDEEKRNWRQSEQFMVKNILDEMNTPDFFREQEKQKIYNVFGRKKMYL